MNPTHLHLILNHVPVVGTLIGGVIFVIGRFWRDARLERVALGLLLVFALLTVPVYLTGESAEHLAERLPGVAEASIDRHQDAALVALLSVEVLGVAALAGLALFQRRVLPHAFAVAILILGVLTRGLFGWTGYLGGQIRHTEIRAASAPGPGDVTESTRRKHDD